MATASGAAAVVGVAGARLLVVAVAQHATDRFVGPAGPVLAVLAVVAAALCLRLAASAALCSVASVVGLRSRGRRAGRWHRLALAAAPSLLRPLVGAVLAGGLLAGTAATAGASAPPPPAATSTVPDVGAARAQLPDPGWPAGPAPTTSPVSDLPQPTWTPPRPTAPPCRLPEVALVAAAPQRGEGPAPVVVRRGDTLWSIAARHLGPAATDADIAAAWPEWWQANRGTVGGDPDLLLPGQVLVAPGAGSPR